MPWNTIGGELVPGPLPSLMSNKSLIMKHDHLWNVDGRIRGHDIELEALNRATPIKATPFCAAGHELSNPQGWSTQYNG